ncbi:MAG: polyprenyl synthetase family protein [Acidimicrobiales bacterium]|nr:polyprenyl synthetase family protein [Acidimicrobiaceae bacterium]MXV88271.1 polyprenyl synthetase family protein [Acidimicrobiales bacterium]MXZ15025.1 polyprenyl synthetase family protein [Acidimicrobiales bacterium]MYB80205.1 polyprenyl synthetase family protein [Acidimicrobiales bacterium]MYG61160.1 polyprenyl synthetase family protein [Acidimicrobiales bacterium]
MAPLSPLQARPDAEADLARVETALRAAAVTGDEFLTEVTSHLIPAGGKRLRPAFVIASALARSPDGAAPDAVTDDMVCGGVAVELVHLGSLYHDDVMDDAETRRGIEAVNHRWGNLKAILAGDFLLAKASELAASLGTEVAALLAATIGRLCEGQVRELQLIYDRSRTEDQYFLAIQGKTAELYATSCRIGGLVAGVDAETLDRLTSFGLAYGMSFQIVDDVLDLVATDEELGKPSGNDLREGVYTLPVIRMLADGHPDGDRLSELLGEPLDDGRRDRARAIVVDGPEIASSVQTAQRYVTAALDALAPLDPTPGVVGLRAAASNLLSALPSSAGAAAAAGND